MHTHTPIILCVYVYEQRERERESSSINRQVNNYRYRSVCLPILLPKEWASLEKCLILGLGRGKYKMNLKHPTLLESKERLKRNHRKRKKGEVGGVA